MDDKIIKIARYDDYLQAEIAKIALESEEIKCFLGGDNFVATYGLYSPAVGGVELCIKESDKEKAMEILANIHKPEISNEDKEYDIICPICKSTNVSYEHYSRWAFLLSFLVLFRVPLSFPVKKYTCKNCGHKWKQEKKF
ncbi:MAG: DUF2007 domain-containing protein [Phycisphaerae bacterium]|jgi:hypothetical protein